MLHHPLVVIPARMGSTRLPGKPLIDLCGKPMIQHTYERAVSVVDRKQVVVATDSDEVARVCASFGARVVLTSEGCLTGTDRVAEVAQEIEAPAYINLQGDEPLMSRQSIRRVIDHAATYPNRLVNGWAWIRSDSEFRSPTIPKVVLREDGRLLYMSRAAVPSSKSGHFIFARRQICVYSFPPDALKEFSSRSAKTAHESCEDIEILRFLEMGWEVDMIELDDSSIAVDTHEDVARVRSVLANGAS